MVSNDFSIVCLFSSINIMIPIPILISLHPSHTTIIHRSSHIRTILPFILLIPHLLLKPLLRKHTRGHHRHTRHHPRHRRGRKSHRRHHEWIWRKWWKWHSRHKRRHIIELLI